MELFHFDGVQWSLAETDLTSPPLSYWGLHGVWGDDTGHLFVAGDQMILHFDGTSWSLATISGFWNAVWGSSATDVYAAGYNGLLHFDGAEWSNPL